MIYTLQHLMRETAHIHSQVQERNSLRKDADNEVIWFEYCERIYYLKDIAYYGEERMLLSIAPCAVILRKKNGKIIYPDGEILTYNTQASRESMYDKNVLSQDDAIGILAQAVTRQNQNQTMLLRTLPLIEDEEYSLFFYTEVPSLIF